MKCPLQNSEQLSLPALSILYVHGMHTAITWLSIMRLEVSHYIGLGMLSGMTHPIWWLLRITSFCRVLFPKTGSEILCTFVCLKKFFTESKKKELI